ncbi:MAG: hypothetical protein WBL61_23395 [Bryobacteraceae bacterium]
MKLDPEYVREYYNSLTDEALLAVDRSDLVEMAQQCYDGEISRRGLARRGARRADDPPAVPVQPENPPDEKLGPGREVLGADGKPTWLADAAEAYSVYVLHRRDEESRVADARQALEAAGIPCYPELVELTPEEKMPLSATHRWRLMVPGNLTFRATSIVDRDIFNSDFEAEWKAHLEALPDKELPAMHPKLVFCGLHDRIDRVTRVYEEEIARRRL